MAAKSVRMPKVPVNRLAGGLGVAVPEEYQGAVLKLLDAARDRGGGRAYLRVDLELPYRPRSTGPRSQQNRIRGHCADIAEQIMSYAKNNGCDMIIMGTHGYKGLERIIFGSVADKVVKNACCPVLTINPYQEECVKK